MQGQIRPDPTTPSLLGTPSSGPDVNPPSSDLGLLPPPPSSLLPLLSSVLSPFLGPRPAASVWPRPHPRAALGRTRDRAHRQGDCRLHQGRQEVQGRDNRQVRAVSHNRHQAGRRNAAPSFSARARIEPAMCLHLCKLRLLTGGGPDALTRGCRRLECSWERRFALCAAFPIGKCIIMYGAAGHQRT